MAGIGLCLLLLGVFPVNPGLGYPPGVAATYSLHGAVHFLVVTLLFGQLSALCFVLARRFVTDAGWAGWARWSRAVGVVAPVFYVGTAVVASPDIGGTGPADWDGLLQRIVLVVGFAWLLLVASRLSATVRPETHATEHQDPPPRSPSPVRTSNGPNIRIRTLQS